MCIGADFAMIEAQLVLAAVVQRYRLRLAPGHRVETAALVTLRPKYGMVMHLEARHAKAASARPIPAPGAVSAG
jgi:cytochrome P450